jgi:hypothetical protein
MFTPVILATVRLGEIRGWLRPSMVMMFAVVVLFVVSTIWPTRILMALHWGVLASFFGLTVVVLFSYLKTASSIDDAHLYTAINIYLLLGMLWFALYSALDVFYPGAIQYGNSTQANHQSDLLYFSLITLSTIGYGDIVAVHPGVRMLAALEGITGVLYVAITVAILVGSYKRESSSD